MNRANAMRGKSHSNSKKLRKVGRTGIVATTAFSLTGARSRSALFDDLTPDSTRGKASLVTRSDAHERLQTNLDVESRNGVRNPEYRWRSAFRDMFVPGRHLGLADSELCDSCKKVKHSRFPPKKLLGVAVALGSVVVALPGICATIYLAERPLSATEWASWTEGLAMLCLLSAQSVTLSTYLAWERKFCKCGSAQGVIHNQFVEDTPVEDTPV